MSRLTVLAPLTIEAVRVPPAEASPQGEGDAVAAEAPTASAPSVPDAADWPLHGRLGLASAALGLASVLTLCLPLIGYVAPAVSGAGLLVGLCGLVVAVRSGKRP